MSVSLPELLIARAKRPELGRLFAELHRRMGSSSRRVARVSLQTLTEAEKVALADLLGLDYKLDASISLRTRDIAKGFGLEQEGLRDLVEAVKGPLSDRAAERLLRAKQREELWAWFRARVADRDLGAWVDHLQASPIPNADLSHHRERLEKVAAVLDRIPAEGTVLSVLARSCTGDPHGLDWGRWIPSRVLEAIACENESEAAPNAEGARALWDRVGVVTDLHSVAVSILGLRALGETPLASILRGLAEQGEPASVTLSQLQRWPVTVAPTSVYLFENASVISVAADLRWQGPALVCTAGWPNTAVILLCRQLARCGCQLFHHGDFDPTGIEITRHLFERVSVQPWHMDSADYLALADRSSTAFQGRVTETAWDPTLAEAMQAKGKVVYEEDCVDALLGVLKEASE